LAGLFSTHITGRNIAYRPV